MSPPKQNEFQDCWEVAIKTHFRRYEYKKQVLSEQNLPLERRKGALSEQNFPLHRRKRALSLVTIFRTTALKKLIVQNSQQGRSGGSC